MEDKPPPYPGDTSNYDPKYSAQAGPPPPPYTTGQPIHSQPGPTYGTVVSDQPTSTLHILTSAVVFTDASQPCICPYCQENILTVLDYQPGTMAWLICLFLCFIGCWFGCCLIPFCVDSCKDVIHTCPNCEGTIGTYRRL